MTVRLYTDQDKDRWDKYVMVSNSSTSYHLTGWKHLIEKSFGHKTFYLLFEDSDKEIKGILPLVSLSSVFFGNFMVSLPYFNYGGVCADSDEICKQLIMEASNIAEKEGAEHIEMRHTRHINNELQEKKTKVSMRLELPGTSEELWKGFPSKLRSQVNRPIKEKMYSNIGKLEELDNFYKVFSCNMRDLGTPVYSKMFFKNILTEFPNSTYICTVYTEDEEPVASGFLTGFKEMLEIPWASSLRSFNKYSPNMLLYWSSLKYACQEGYKYFDFGRSTPGEGTYKFKKQWGTKPVQLYWHYWLRNGQTLPELNPNNPKYRLAIKIWQNLPVGITRLLGPVIVKNLP